MVSKLSKKDLILVVDDVEMNRIILEEILKADYEIKQVESGIEAVSFLFNAKTLPEMVLLDIMMPEMDGFEVLDTMQSSPLTNKIPVIFITAADADTNETRGLEAGAVDYIEKPFNPDVVKIRVKNNLELKHYREKLENLVEEKVQQLTKTKEDMILTMANVIEYRNLESGHHVKRTSELSKILINKMLEYPKYAKELLESNYGVIIKSVPIHDIGKIAIPDNILLKPGRLTDEEFEVIKTHAPIGGDIINSLLANDDEVYLKHSRDIARHHHERWDGKGYPDGIAAEAIPLSARILSVVDVYDALISKRVYKDAYAHEDVIKIIKECAGTQFDPGIVEVLLEISDDFESVSKSLMDEKE